MRDSSPVLGGPATYLADETPEAVPGPGAPPTGFFLISDTAMRDRKESKTRQVDQETRQSGSWTGVGFVIIVIGVVIAVLLLILGSA